MLAGFPVLETAIENGRFVCRHGDATLTFYTERSQTRDLRQFESLIRSDTSNSIPLLVAPYAATLEPLFAHTQRFFFLAPAQFTDSLPNDERLIADDEALERFINQITPNDKFVIHILPQWQNLAGMIGEAVHTLLARAAKRLKTIQHFARLWPINFRLNYHYLKELPDIRALNLAPDIIALAGPSLDKLPAIASRAVVWCADTALPVLLHHHITPQVIFALDAGFASQEHFVGAHNFIASKTCDLVADPLCAPAILRLPFRKKFIYANSHPLIQEFTAKVRSDLTLIRNPEGNVGGLMLAVLNFLFPAAKARVIGYDRGHVSYVTHARGTAYFRRSAMNRSRTNTMETYSFHLSSRYGKAQSSGIERW